VLSDWLDSFMDCTESAAAPPIFRLWAGISCIAGALERRVWVQTLQDPVFPHLFTWLIGPPTTGKGQAIGPVERIWHKARGGVFGHLKVAPRSMTKASMIDYMKGAQRRIPISKFRGQEGKIDLLEYCSIQILSEELGVFISAHDLDFLSNLTNIYNAPPIYSETRRGGNIDIEIFNPQINWLAGTQPAFLANLLPEEAWGQGTMSRVIMIYSGVPVRKPLFGEEDFGKPKLESQLAADLSQLLDLYGQFSLEASATQSIMDWHEAGMEPYPRHSKLVHYCGRRHVHLIKLCMVASLSRNNSLIITQPDFDRAKGWLLSAEQAMPDVFRDMVGKSDKQVMDELHYYMYQAWKDKKPTHITSIKLFLASRIPSEKINRLIDVMEKSNMIARQAGSELYIPRPLHQHGVE